MNFSLLLLQYNVADSDCLKNLVLDEDIINNSDTTRTSEFHIK